MKIACDQDDDVAAVPVSRPLTREASRNGSKQPHTFLDGQHPVVGQSRILEVIAA